MLHQLTMLQRQIVCLSPDQELSQRSPGVGPGVATVLLWVTQLNTFVDDSHLHPSKRRFQFGADKPGETAHHSLAEWTLRK